MSTGGATENEGRPPARRNSRWLIAAWLTALLAVSGASWSQEPPHRPAWLALPLTDVATGETFTLGEFEGRSVYVEAMATWCTNCRRLLQSVKEAVLRAEGDDYVFIGLSVEANLPDQTLAEYARRWAFPLRFAVATPELLAALIGDYGREVAVPPSTPHFLVRSDGTVTGLNLGFKSPDEILMFVWRGSDMTSAPPQQRPWTDLDQIY